MSFEVMTVIAELRFRCLVPEDLPQVRLLDDAAYEWDAWRPEQWDELLRLTNISGKVLVDLRGVILGFMVYVLHMDRVTLVRLAVADTRMNEQFMRLLLEELCGNWSKPIEAFIHERDLVSLRFLRSIGWKGLLHPSSDHEDDTVRMVYSRAESTKVTGSVPP